MFRGIPSTSKLLQKKWAEKDKKIHQRKLKEVRSCITLAPPAEQKHLISRPKQDQLKEERLSKIEHENKMLLDKMAKIMTSSSMSKNSSSSLPRTQPFEKKSLNGESRKRELFKITMEN